MYGFIHTLRNLRMYKLAVTIALQPVIITTKNELAHSLLLHDCNIIILLNIAQACRYCMHTCIHANNNIAQSYSDFWGDKAKLDL